MAKDIQKIGRVNVAKKYLVRERLLFYLRVVFSKNIVRSFLVILSFLSVFFLAHSGAYKSFYLSSINNIVSVFYNVISYPIYGLNALYCYFIDEFNKWHYQEDITLLVKQKISMQKKLDILEGENRQLKKFAHFIDAPQKFNFTTARVTNIILRNGEYNFLVNVGKEDGVRAGCAVVNEIGIVGRVYDVSAHSAIIIPVTQVDFTIPAIVLSTGRQLIVNGASHDKLMRISYINDNSAASNHRASDSKIDDKSKGESQKYLKIKDSITTDPSEHTAQNAEEIGKEGDIVVTFSEVGVIPYGIKIGHIHFVHKTPFVQLCKDCRIGYLVKIFFESDIVKKDSDSNRSRK